MKSNFFYWKSLVWTVCRGFWPKWTTIKHTWQFSLQTRQNTKYQDLQSREGVRQKYCWGDAQLPIMPSFYALCVKNRGSVVFLSVLWNLS